MLKTIQKITVQILNNKNVNKILLMPDIIYLSDNKNISQTRELRSWDL